MLGLRNQDLRWSNLILVTLGSIGIVCVVVLILLQRRFYIGILISAIVMLTLGPGWRPRQHGVSDSRAAQWRQVNILFVVSITLGIVLELGAAANLLGLLGTTPQGGFKNNSGAMLAICFGALALAFAYGAYRGKQRLAAGRRREGEDEG